MSDDPALAPDAPPRLAERRIVAHGVLAILAITDDARSGTPSTRSQWMDRLPPEERSLAATMAPPRLSTFVAGREALRAALAGLDASLAATPIGRDPRGAPLLPTGLAGSISHKTDVAIALATRTDQAAPYHALGVDLETIVPRAPGAPDIARKVLTAAERDAIASLEAAERDVEVLLRFSLKEAVYKAIAPLAQRWIGFTEVEVHPLPDGSARIDHRIAEAAARGITFDARWQRDGARLITSIEARAR